MNSTHQSRRKALLTLSVLLVAALFAQPLRASTAAENATADNTAFAFDLYGQLKGGEGNLFFSSYSISTCLAMVYAGARDGTETQMAHALHFNTNQPGFHRGFGALQSQLNAIQQKKDIQLNIANGLWAQKDHRFLTPFLNLATKTYDAKLAQVDFRTAAEPARKEINDWVSQRTKGKITDLLAPEVMDPSTRLVLVNAIYFKGKWLNVFKKDNTADAPFSVTTDQKIQTPMMNTSASFNYAESDELQLLELPYLGGDVSMVVLLPKKLDGLKPLENSLNPKQLGDLVSQAHKQKVIVFLPKFKMTQEFGLTGTLKAMGMTDAFSPNADFSGMDGIKDLFLSAVVHKAFVEVNEEGTEAAAATGATMSALAMRRPDPIPIFRADHPFLFLIRDTHSGIILFLGRINNPGK